MTDSSSMNEVGKKDILISNRALQVFSNSILDAKLPPHELVSSSNVNLVVQFKISMRPLRVFSAFIVVDITD